MNGAYEHSIAGLIERIAARESELNTFVHLDAEGARSQARRQDANGVDGALAGLPVAVKDNVATYGAPWGCGSATRRELGPAEHDAEVVRRLRAAGAIVVGTTNLDEFAMGASTESSAWGPSHNPWDIRRSPGGSSGGSAAAAAAYGILAVGTDTGGSIREPASQCGVVGVKPTSGTIPVGGVVPFAETLDSVGPLASTVDGAARLHDVMAGRTAMSPAVALGRERDHLRGVRIAVLQEMSGVRNRPGVLATFERAVAHIADLGADVVELSVPTLTTALELYFEVSSAESVRVLERYESTGLLGTEALHRLEHGRAVKGTARLRDALAARTRLTTELRAALDGCSVAISPTMPLVAPLLGRAGIDDPLAPPSTDCWTVAANLADVPSLSLPAGVAADSGLPSGLQLMAASGSDERLYEIAIVLESTGLGG